MNEDNTKYLNEKYPTFFNLSGDPLETLMCFGFSVGDGWFDIIDDLCQTIQTYLEIEKPEWLNPDNEYKFEVVQVKEKFGTLRFYPTFGDDFIFAVELLYEQCSGTICEMCGEPGSIRRGGWIQTLCDEHSEGREASTGQSEWSHQDKLLDTYLTTMESMVAEEE